ncbi:MAG: hypothetical protein HC905_18020 [Bacteroidales bacterium]|nr:hypothetical protein [Bacteroidales bacterium]
MATCLARGQKSEPENLRNITVTRGDTVIKTTICYQYPKIDVKTAANFYWYYAGEIHKNAGSYSGKPLHGKYELFDKSNNLLEQGNFEFGLKTGIWTRWYTNGFKKEVIFYKEGLLNGELFSIQ